MPRHRQQIWLRHLYPNKSIKWKKEWRVSEYLHSASHMIAAIYFLDQRSTRRTFFHAPALSCDPRLRLSLFLSKAFHSLVLGTAHAIVSVLVARRTDVRET